MRAPGLCGSKDAHSGCNPLFRVVRFVFSPYLLLLILVHLRCRCCLCHEPRSDRRPDRDGEPRGAQERGHLHGLILGRAGLRRQRARQPAGAQVRRLQVRHSQEAAVRVGNARNAGEQRHLSAVQDAVVLGGSSRRRGTGDCKVHPAQLPVARYSLVRNNRPETEPKARPPRAEQRTSACACEDPVAHSHVSLFYV